MNSNNVKQFEEPEDHPELQQQSSQRLVDVKITDNNIALNVLVSFLVLAQKKGTFSFEESAKIWECIEKFKS